MRVLLFQMDANQEDRELDLWEERLKKRRCELERLAEESQAAKRRRRDALQKEEDDLNRLEAELGQQECHSVRSHSSPVLHQNRLEGELRGTGMRSSTATLSQPIREEGHSVRRRVSQGRGVPTTDDADLRSHSSPVLHHSRVFVSRNRSSDVDIERLQVQIPGKNFRLPVPSYHPDLPRKTWDFTVERRTGSRTSKDKQMSACEYCGPIEARKLRYHIDVLHLPWFVLPDKICFVCEKAEGTINKVLRSHGDRSKCMLLRKDIGFEVWVDWMMIALRAAQAFWKLESLELLLEKVCKDQLHPPPHSEQPPSARLALYLRAWDVRLGHVAKDSYSLAPPSDVVCLATKPVMRHWIMALPMCVQDEIRKASTTSILDQQRINAMPISNSVYVIDSHVHCDVLLRRSSSSSWAECRVDIDFYDQYPRIQTRVSKMVFSANFPEYWISVEEILKDTSISLSVGIHPHVASKKIGLKVLDRQRELLQLPQCKAIGEIGLDYYSHSKPEERAMQREYLHEILHEVNGRPIVIHCRGSRSNPSTPMNDLLKILSRRLQRSHRLYIHCFSGSVNDVRIWRNSFPSVHFGIGRQYPTAEVLAEITVDYMLLESDAPYQCRSPANLGKLTVDVGDILNLPSALVGEVTYRNAERFFQI